MAAKREPNSGEDPGRLAERALSRLIEIIDDLDLVVPEDRKNLVDDVRILKMKLSRGSCV